MSRFARLDARTFSRARRELAAADPTLGAWIARVRPTSPPPASSHFRSLVRAILSQQLSNAAARTVCERALALCRKARAPQPEELLALDEGALRGAGVSGPKIRALRSLATAFSSGELARCAFHRLSDEEIVQRLCTVKGIGRWTAEMFLLFSLRRADVWAPGDLALAAGVRRLIGVAELSGEEAARLAERWRPWRSLAALTCWRIAHWREDERPTRSSALGTR
ncbi:MAG: DNA-3-methyladenine glycosylase 2 family protein [Planctomycetes bacterium]|nr:DNA-3-methyladenine glycosylase 2 family protein [Planctomycetota bacterium]